MKTKEWWITKQESLPNTTTIDHLQERCAYYRSIRDGLGFDVTITFENGVQFKAIALMDEPPQKDIEDYLGFWDILNDYQKSGFTVKDCR